MSNEDLLTLQLKIRFASNEEGRARWLEYGNVLLRLFQAFAPRGAEPIIALYPMAEESNLGYKIGYELSVARSVREPSRERSCQRVLVLGLSLLASLHQHIELS
ncbi:MAG TPA: hypothetical protein VNA15_05090 [Candidatus Angelobacter sp.]|nr:hypothetical protein [Candidatus Angelobacter sp.]